MISKLQPLLIGLTILSLPWYIWRGSLLSVPFTATEVIVWLTIALYLAVKIWQRQPWHRPPNIWIGLGLAWLAVSVLSVIVSQQSIDALGIFKAYFLAPVVFAYIIFDFVAQQGKPGLIWLTNAVVLLIVQISALCFSQWLLDWPNFAPHELSQGRSSATFNSANAVGLLIGPWLIWPALAAVLLSTQQKIRLAGIALSLFGLMAVLLTHSEGAMIALAGSLGLTAIVYTSRKHLAKLKSVWKTAIISVALLVYAAATIYFVANVNDPPQVANPYTRPNFTTMTIRQCLWQGTWQSLQTSPIVGHGLAGFTPNYLDHATCDAEPFVYPHNLILNFWSELGLAGLLSALVMLGVMAKYSIDLIGHDQKAANLVGLVGIAAVSYWLIHGLVDVPYFKNDLSLAWWISVAVVVASHRLWSGPLHYSTGNQKATDLD